MNSTLGVRGKLFFTFSVTLILFLLFAGLTAAELFDIRSRQLTARGDAATASKLVLTLQTDEQQLQLDTLLNNTPASFVSTGDAPQVQSINAIFQQLQTPVTTLKAYYQAYHPQTVQTLEQIDNLLQAHHEQLASFVTALRQAKASTQYTLIQKDGDFVNNLGVIQAMLAKIETDITTRTQGVIDLTVALLIIFSFCFMLIGLVLTTIMGFAINNPLKRLLMVTKDIASGDLQKRVDIKARDEFGTLAKSFNSMADSLSFSIQELRSEKAKLQASISSLTVGFILVGEAQRITTINKAALHMLWPDLKQGDFESLTLAALVKKMAGIIDLQAIIDKAVSSRELTVIDELAITDRFFKFVITPIVQDGKAIGSVILVDDITESKIVERSKDEFFSIASHELRTPLTAIKGNTAMIEEHYKDQLRDPLLNEMITDIHESSDRLIGIVNDFLDMSRLQQGKMAFENKAFDINETVEDTIREYQVASTQHKTKLEFVRSSKLPLVFADPNKVKQVLVNLIGNSFKFTPSGTVTIAAVAVKQGSKVSHIKVLVSDTGEGIPAANQKLLFRKFQQAGDSLLTRDTTKGTGLGLYISKLIVEGMQGTITLEKSEIGKGSTFSFILPVANDEQLHSTEASVSVRINTTTGLAEPAHA